MKLNSSSFQSPLLSVQQVAKLISVSPSMIYSLVDRGLIECHRIGRCIRFSETQVHKYLSTCGVSKPIAQPRKRLKHLDN